MKTKQQLLAELFTTCLELNDEHFTVFFDYAGHIDMASIRVCSKGYNNNPFFDYSRYLSITEEKCQEVIAKLHQLKTESIAERERLEKDAEYKKQKRKEELLRELEELED